MNPKQQYLLNRVLQSDDSIKTAQQIELEALLIKTYWRELEFLSHNPAAQLCILHCFRSLIINSTIACMNALLESNRERSIASDADMAKRILEIDIPYKLINELLKKEKEDQR